MARPGPTLEREAVTVARPQHSAAEGGVVEDARLSLLNCLGCRGFAGRRLNGLGLQASSLARLLLGSLLDAEVDGLGEFGCLGLGDAFQRPLGDQLFPSRLGHWNLGFGSHVHARSLALDSLFGIFGCGFTLTLKTMTQIDEGECETTPKDAKQRVQRK